MCYGTLGIRSFWTREMSLKHSHLLKTYFLLHSKAVGSLDIHVHLLLFSLVKKMTVLFTVNPFNPNINMYVPLTVLHIFLGY